MRFLRVGVGVVVATVVSVAVRGAFSAGPSPKDLRPFTAAGMTLQFPGKPEKFDIDIPPANRAVIKSMENYQWKSRTFQVAASKIGYAAGIEGNAESFLEGALNGAAEGEKMTRVRNDKKPVTMAGGTGLRYTATFRKDTADVEAQGLIVTKGPVLWQVFVVYMKDNAQSRETATKMVDSVEIVP